MMTVTSMSQNAYMTYRLSKENSLFALLSSQKPPSYITGLSGNSNSIFSSLNNVNSMNSFPNVISNHFSQQETMKKFEDYTKKSDAFFSEFYPAMENLRSSSNALKDSDFSADHAADVVANVKNFADDYNNATKLFQDHRKDSGKLAALASSFADIKYDSRVYATIGLNISESGKISVDEDKLKAALTDDSQRVEDLLGGKGLASQAYKKAFGAIANADDLIPLPNMGNTMKNSVFPGLLLDMFI